MCEEQSEPKWRGFQGQSVMRKSSSISVMEACGQSKCKREGKRSLKRLEHLKHGLEGGVYKILVMPS